MSDYFERIERQLVARASTQRRRRSAALPRLGGGLGGRLVAASAVLVVIAVVGVFIGVGQRGRGQPRAGAAAAKQVVFTAQGGSVRASVATLRDRLAAAVPGVHVTRAGDLVTVTG